MQPLLINYSLPPSQPGCTGYLLEVNKPSPSEPRCICNLYVKAWPHYWWNCLYCLLCVLYCQCLDLYFIWHKWPDGYLLSARPTLSSLMQASYCLSVSLAAILCLVTSPHNNSSCVCCCLRHHCWLTGLHSSILLHESSEVIRHLTRHSMYSSWFAVRRAPGTDCFPRVDMK